MVEIDGLLAPITETEPTGEDLEYDPAFLAAFRAAEGTAARQMGDSLVAAAEPDWRQVRDRTGALFARTKDLRLAVLLAQALLRVEGLPGLHRGLALVHALTGRYWDRIHPRLDPEDDNDPTTRVNVLLGLCSRELLLDGLRTAPLVRSRVFGPVSYRDIEIAEGRSPPLPDTEALDAATVRGAFQDCDLEALREGSAAAVGALAEIEALGAALAARLRTDQVPDLQPLFAPLSAIARILNARLAERLPAASGERSPIPLPVAGPGAAATALAVGDIASREDVVRAIDRLCDYYSRCEPSSPVPLLLKRAQRLATGSFVDIVRDLAPDALAEIERVCGLGKEGG